MDRKFLLCLTLLLLTGCATWSKHRILPGPDGRFRVAVVPFRSEVRIKKLKYIRTLPKHFKPSPGEESRARSEFEAVRRGMTASLEDALAATGDFTVVPDTEVREAMLALSISTDSAKLTRGQLARLGGRLDAPAVLDVGVGGYGKVRKKWYLYMFLDGTGETVTQGVATAAATSNPWIIAGVVGEEALQEMSFWAGGLYFFDRFFTPVILDARMVSASDRKVAWKESAFATINWKALRKLPKPDRKKKEVRLKLASDKALQKLARSVVAAARRNLRRWKRSAGTSS